MNACSIAFVAGFLIFKFAIQPDDTKVPGDPAMFLRDFIWLLYWRWNLDYLIFPAFAATVLVSCFILRKCIERGASKDALGTYLVPALTFAGAFLYMIAIDVAVTWFADVYIDGNWESSTRLFMGLTAQGLYHTFFFWVIPVVIIAATCMQAFLRAGRYVVAAKTFLVCYAAYCLCLGFLDPVVCHVIGMTPEGAAGGWYWGSFGDWAMGGADAIWASGWIAHYVLLSVISLLSIPLLGRVVKEMEAQAGHARLSLKSLFSGPRQILSLMLTLAFIAWYAGILPALLPVFYFG